MANESFNDQGYGQAFRGQGTSPAYGFSQTYQSSPQAQALGAVLEALQDPRNQWMGTGLAGGTIRGLGGLRNLFVDRAAAKAGGFNVPLHEMQRNVPMAKQSPMATPGVPSSFVPPRPTEQYVNAITDSNTVAKDMQYGDMLQSIKAREAYDMFSPRIQEEVNRAMIGQQQLRDLNKRAITQTEGPPPEMIRRLFGIKE